MKLSSAPQFAPHVSLRYLSILIEVMDPAFAPLPTPP